MNQENNQSVARAAWSRWCNVYANILQDVLGERCESRRKMHNQKRRELLKSRKHGGQRHHIAISARGALVMGIANAGGLLACSAGLKRTSLQR